MYLPKNLATLQLDCKYPWSGITCRQTENGVENYHLFHNDMRRLFGELLMCKRQKIGLEFRLAQRAATVGITMLSSLKISTSWDGNVSCGGRERWWMLARDRGLSYRVLVLVIVLIIEQTNHCSVIFAFVYM